MLENYAAVRESKQPLITPTAYHGMHEHHVQPHPRLSPKIKRNFKWALNWFYFTLGVNLALPVLPTKTILMDELKCSPATMAFVMSWLNIPWSIKPLYGFISDSMPIRGYRRGPYLSLGLICNGLSWAVLWYVGAALGFYNVFCWLFLSSLSLVVADAAIDSLIADTVQLESSDELGELQSEVWISRSLGSLLAALFAGIAMDHLKMTSEGLFGVAAICALSGLFAVQFIYEDKVDANVYDRPRDIMRARFQDLLQFWSKEAIWKTCLFVLLFSASPTSGDVIFYFMRNSLGFSLSFLGVLTIAGYASYIIGSWLYRDHLRDLPFRTLLKGTIWVAFFVGMTTVVLVKRWNLIVYVPDHAFVFGDTVFLAVCAQIAFMPIIVLAAKIAPKGAEGTIYNSVMSVSNLGSVISEFSGGVLTKMLGVREDNFENLWKLVLICNLTTLLPLPFLRMLPEIRDLLKPERIPVTIPVASDDDESSLSTHSEEPEKKPTGFPNELSNLL